MNKLDQLKSRLLAKGFGAIKFELEANLGRDGDETECSECYGRGSASCGDCVGGSAYDRATDSYSDCLECNGSGDVTCDYCDGNGYRSTDDFYLEAFRNNLSAEANNALAYANFYYDGSVDSELTATIKVEDLHLLPEYVKAFRALSSETGQFDTDDAGLHLSVMRSTDYGSGSLDADKLINFERQMKKLMPALFFLASCDHTSRGLGYRLPRVSDSKYSAIHTFSGGIEYRVFQPCFQKPEAILDYVAVIAKSLRFYSKTVKAPSRFKQFSFDDDGVNSLARFYMTSDNMRVLNETVSVIAPEGKTLDQLKTERRLNVGKRRVAKMQAKEQAAYDEYVAGMKRHIRDNIRRELQNVAASRRSHSEVLTLNREGLRNWIQSTRERLLADVMSRERYEQRGDSRVTVTI